jgi:pimeloyl-ACP methyl ester carboxylesterase
MTSIEKTNCLPLILIHGRDSSKESFMTLLSPLSTRLGGATVICIDLPGHGTDVERAPPTDAYASNEAFVEAVERRISTALGSDTARFTILGHSMGARAAVLVAALRPARVAALLIEDMSMSARGHLPWSDALLATFSGPFHSDWDSVRRCLAPFGYDDAWLERKRAGGMIHRVKEARVDALRGPFLSSTDPTVDADDQVAGVWFLGTDPRVTKLAQQLLISTSHHALLEQISASGLPIHAILAEPRRSACEASEADVLRRQCRSVEIIRGAGHSIHATHRDEFIDAVARAIDECNVNTSRSSSSQTAPGGGEQ